jgi:cyclase
MLKLRIIPTLLFKNLKLVKGKNFDSWRTVGSVIQAIKIYSIRNVDEIILLNISATNENKKIDLQLVNDVANECFMPLTVGGGINSIEDISLLLKAGADKVCINTAAAENIELIKKASSIFGSQCIVVSIDYRKINNTVKLFTHSGRVETKLILEEHLINTEKAGAGEIMLTSIDRDGTMSGYDIETIKYVSELVNIPIIASGGAGDFENILKLAKETCVSGIAAASIYHFTKKTPNDVKKYLLLNNLPIRI